MKSDCSLGSKSSCSGDNCVCYDTCPLGKAWFGYNLIDKNQWVYLPCSGKGVCKSGGACQCFGGYIGNNC